MNCSNGIFKKFLLTYIICILHFLPLNLTITYLLYQRSIQTSLSNFAYVVNSNVEFITFDIVMRIAKEKENYSNLSSINTLPNVFIVFIFGEIQASHPYRCRYGSSHLLDRVAQVPTPFSRSLREWKRWLIPQSHFQ